MASVLSIGRCRGVKRHNVVDGWCRVGKKVPDREQAQGTEVRVGLGEQKN